MKWKNNVELIGYLGLDPHPTQLSDGSLRVKIRLATCWNIKKKNGERIQKTTWHDIIVWGKLAEWARRSFVKGSHALVEGQIIYRTYEDHTGHTRYITEINAQHLMNLDR